MCHACKRESLGVANVGKHHFENPLKGCEYTHYKLHLHTFSEQRALASLVLSDTSLLRWVREMWKGENWVLSVPKSQGQVVCVSCGQAAFYWGREEANLIWERRQQIQSKWFHILSLLVLPVQLNSILIMSTDLSVQHLLAVWN